MDINFHYFAVKTLALAAGFAEGEAQTIATFSEFADDYNLIAYIKCNNIPDYIKNDRNCDLYVPPEILTNFNPAMTGFSDYIDYGYLSTERAQKFTVSPFHFVPQSYSVCGDKHARTVPATIGDGSLISGLLLNAKERYWDSGGITALMRIGLHLHTFADTYAHQLFTGYDSWANEVNVTDVLDNNDGSNITGAIVETLHRNLPPLGHAQASHAPDLTYVSFAMKYRKSKDEKTLSGVHSRSNTMTFTQYVSKHIINYLLSCLNRPEIGQRAWDDLAERLHTVFMIPYTGETSIDTFAANWKTRFPDYAYHYNVDSVNKAFWLNKTSDGYYTDAFYQYNYLASNQLNRMYGPKPRELFKT